NSTQISISPDGSRIAYVTADRRIVVRSMNSLVSHDLDGTGGAVGAFWSPDSRYIAFFAGGKLKTIEASGGPIQDLCDASGNRGGTWNVENVILFAQDGLTLRRVSAVGGVPTDIARLDSSRKEISQNFPYFLPDGKHFLYISVSAEAS